MSQLDAVVVAEGKAKGIVKSGEVVPYLDEQGRPKAPPTTYQEREANPSDHRMVKVVLDFKKIREAMAQPQPASPGAPPPQLRPHLPR